MRDDDPKGTVGKGLLEKPTNLDMSEGWGDLANADKLNEDVENDTYYNEAARKFLEAYSKQFSDATLSELDVNTLAGYAQHSRPTLNNTFKILMETIYDYLEGPKP